VLLDDAAAERQAEAGATERAGVGGVALLEAVEDLLQFFRSDAAALVLDNETDLAVVAFACGLAASRIWSPAAKT
jgi:hypothetical protein